MYTIYQTPTIPQRKGPASTSGTAAMSGLDSTPDVVRIHSFRTSQHIAHEKRQNVFWLIDRVCRKKHGVKTRTSYN